MLDYTDMCGFLCLHTHLQVFRYVCVCVPPENVTVLSMCAQNLGDLSAVAYMLRSL